MKSFAGSFAAFGLVMFSAGAVVTESKGVVQINKIAAAQRQLDSAIRMFFQKEDELAIYTVAAAAFGILRDILKKRGGHFTKNLLGRA